MTSKGYIPSLEHRKKLSLSHMGLKNHLGFKHSESTKLHLGEIRIGQKHSEETKIKMRLSAKKGEESHLWKKNVGYRAIHNWVERVLGKPSLCSFCKTTEAKRFNWANISKKYLRDVTDWVRLCARCHKLFDLGRINL